MKCFITGIVMVIISLFLAATTQFHLDPNNLFSGLITHLFLFGGITLIARTISGSKPEY